MKKAPRERLYHLDLIRFIAALFVVFYHYGFRGYAKDNMSLVRFEPLEWFSKYGYLGVNLFFIISGFVILMSAKNSTLNKFIVSRISRLYPAYWVCVILTAAIIYYFGANTFSVTLNQVLFNLTMLNGFFEVEYVDGVYWSLLVELKFYILIGIILLFKKIKHIKIFALILLGISILRCIVPFTEAPTFLKVVYYLTFPRWSSYFVAGMFFFLIKTEKNILKNIIPVIIAYMVSMWYAINYLEHKNLVYGDVYSPIVVGVLITLFYLVIFLISINKIGALNKRVFLYFGILTYPLYLIHQNIGFIVFNHFYEQINKWVLFFTVLLVMLISSYLISKHIEKPFGNYLRIKLKKILK